MLTRIANLPIRRLQPHHPRRLRQPLPQVHDVTLDEHFGAHGRGAQIRAVKRSADVALVREC